MHSNNVECVELSHIRFWAVKIPAQNLWKKKTVKLDFDAGKFETFFADEAMDKLRPLGDYAAATSDGGTP